MLVVDVKKTVPSTRMKMAGVPTSPRRARPGTVKVFTFTVVLITDNAALRHCGVCARRYSRTVFFCLYETRREEHLTRLENDVL
jgi:hypothetical protein